MDEIVETSPESSAPDAGGSGESGTAAEGTAESGASSEGTGDAPAAADIPAGDNVNAASGAGDAVDLGAAAGGAESDTMTSAPDALQSAADLLEAGGPVVIILLAMSIVALAIILAKLWQLAGAGLTDRRGVERVLAEAERGDLATAGQAAKSGRGPAMRALEAALAHPTDQDRAREAAWVAASGEIESARSWLRPLEVIGALAPLLGLFGTVLGMIAAFAELEAAGSRVDPSILSGGIWEALLTTAVGLAVAIPAVAAFNWFERRIERAESLAERAVSALFTTIAPAGTIATAPETPAVESRLHAVAQG